MAAYRNMYSVRLSICFRIVKITPLWTSIDKHWKVFRTNGGIWCRIVKITPLYCQVLTIIDKHGKVLTSISSKWWHMFQLCGNHAARIEELIPPERLNMSDPRYNQQPAFCTRNILGVINYNLEHESQIWLEQNFFWDTKNPRTPLFSLPFSW